MATGERRRVPGDIEGRASGVPPASSEGVFGRTVNPARRGGPRPDRGPEREGLAPELSAPATRPGATSRSLTADAADVTAAFAPDRRPPSSLTPTKGRPPLPDLAPVAELDVEETRYFGRPANPAAGTAMPPPPLDKIDLLAEDFDSLGPSYGSDDPFGSSDYLGHEPTPALLAAKAEPLGDSSTARRPSRKSQRPSQRSSQRPRTRSSNPAEAARASKTRPQTKRKPKEPSKLVLGLSILGVILVGAAAAYWYNGRDNTGGTPSSTETVATEPTTAGTGDPVTATSQPPASPAATVTPFVIFDEAAVGPITAGTPYNVAAGGGPASASYRLVVDEQPQAEPAATLAPATFTPGRHLLVIEITSPDANLKTDPVVVYAVGETPPKGYRANLASVNTGPTQGWGEAVRQFDEFVAAGHTQLKLMPSDPFPSLAPGYWNIFVDGFADADAAKTYCTQFNLAIPDQCFVRLFDPNAPAGA